jgi:hypothetical protein
VNLLLIQSQYVPSVNQFTVSTGKYADQLFVVVVSRINLDDDPFFTDCEEINTNNCGKERLQRLGVPFGTILKVQLQRT